MVQKWILRTKTKERPFARRVNGVGQAGPRSTHRIEWKTARAINLDAGKWLKIAGDLDAE
jgi:hypothetical protein